MNRTSRFTHIPSTREAAVENDPRFVKRLIVGLATTVLVSGGVAGVVGMSAGTAQADTGDDHCSTRSGCYKGPGDRWCPGDYVWPGLVATGWDLSVCHVYHEQCPPGYYGGCPDNIVEGPPPPYVPGLPFCPIPPWCP
jgi:hypothetical protein